MMVTMVINDILQLMDKHVTLLLGILWCRVSVEVKP